MFCRRNLTKGKIENSVKAGRLCHHLLYKGGDSNGFRIHNLIYDTSVNYIDFHKNNAH